MSTRPYPKTIMEILRTYQRSMTATEVAEKAHISRYIAKKRLNELHKKGIIQKMRAGKRTKWRVPY